MISVEQIKAAAVEAICQSGPRKGLFKRNCPPMGTLGAAYWQAAMIVVDPHKASIFQIAMFTPEQHDLYFAAVKQFDAMKARHLAKKAA